MGLSIVNRSFILQYALLLNCALKKSTNSASKQYMSPHFLFYLKKRNEKSEALVKNDYPVISDVSVCAGAPESNG